MSALGEIATTPEPSAEPSPWLMTLSMASCVERAQKFLEIPRKFRFYKREKFHCGFDRWRSIFLWRFVSDKQLLLP